jgi:thioredoxin-related protein
MKKLILSLICLSYITCFGQEKIGINFKTDRKWTEVLAEAKAEHKLVFVDMYTEWCGPCKVMDTEVFPLTNVGEIYNTSFISYKFDAEKGEEPAIKKKYVVASYPNYLFIDGDGTLIYRSGGSMTPAEFIKVATNALQEAKQEQTIVQMEFMYPSHKAEKAFMYKYLSRLTTLRLPTTELLDNYIAMLTANEQAEPKNIQLIVDNGTFLNPKLQLGIALNVLKRNAAVYSELKAKGMAENSESIASIENNAMQVSLRKAIATKDLKLFSKVQSLEKDASVDPFNNKQTLAMEYYYDTMNFQKYKHATNYYVRNVLLQIPSDTLDKWDKHTYDEEKAIIEKQNNPKYNNEAYINTYKHTQTIQLSNRLSKVCEKILTVPLTKTDIQEVKRWAGKAVQIAKSDSDYYKNVYPFYRRTYAMVLYKSNEKQAAIKEMQNIIDSLPKSPQVQQQFGELLLKMVANAEI